MMVTARRDFEWRVGLTRNGGRGVSEEIMKWQFKFHFQHSRLFLLRASFL